MKSLDEIKADKKFNQWLYGGSGAGSPDSNDLDKEIKPLIYECYLSGIRTIWSCASHIGQTICDHITGKAPEGFFLYTPGLLLYQLENEAERRLDSLVVDLINQNPFLRFESIQDPKRKDLIADYYDLSSKMNCVWAERDGRERPLNVVPKDLAIARKAKIDSIWNYLAQEVEKFPKVVSP